MALEHSSEIMLILYRVPFEHSTCKDTVAVFIVTDDFIDTSDTPSDSTTRCFHDFLENCKIQVIEETNRDIDWVTCKSLNHLYD